MESWYPCEHCGRTAIFRRFEEFWKRRCVFCWKGDKHINLTQGERYALKLEMEIVDLKKKLIAARRESSKQRQSSNNGFGKKDLDDLLLLCHPDRHGNSTRSNRVTRLILELRKKAA